MTQYVAPPSDAVGVRLDALGCDVNVTIGGGRAVEAASAITRAWDWCLKWSQPARSSALHIQVVLDDDPAVVNAASTRGAIAGTDVRMVLHFLSQAVTVTCIDHLAGRRLMLHAC